MRENFPGVPVIIITGICEVDTAVECMRKGASDYMVKPVEESHRFSVHRIHVPSLKERFDDIPLLVDYFLEEAAQKFKKKKPTVPRELFSLLRTYHFSGNIRELRAMVMNAVSTHSSMILSLKPLKKPWGVPKTALIHLI